MQIFWRFAGDFDKETIDAVSRRRSSTLRVESYERFEYFGANFSHLSSNKKGFWQKKLIFLVLEWRFQKYGWRWQVLLHITWKWFKTQFLYLFGCTSHNNGYYTLTSVYANKVCIYFLFFIFYEFLTFWCISFPLSVLWKKFLTKYSNHVSFCVWFK